MRTNAEVNGTVLEAVAKPDSGGLALLRDAAEAMRLSARGYHRVLRVARTLADLDGEELVRRVTAGGRVAHGPFPLAVESHWRRRLTQLAQI